MLTYRAGAPDVMSGTPLNAHTTLYEAPVDEFAVERIELGPGESGCVPSFHSASILVTIKGGVKSLSSEGVFELRSGSVHALPASPTGEDLTIEAGADGCVMFRARVSA